MINILICDDDIDIAMPRKDYDRFVHMCLDDSRYKILSYETDEKYIYSFAKIEFIRFSYTSPGCV